MRRDFLLIIGTFALQLAIGAQTNDIRQWVGVWQGELDGQPGVTVTLGRDGGDLEGTIVFNVVSREGGEAHVIGHDAHVLIQMQLEGRTLSFQVIRSGDSRVLHLTMRLTSHGKAVLECADCGGSGATELTWIK